MKCYRRTEFELRLRSGKEEIVFPSTIKPIVIDEWHDPVSKEEDSWVNWIVKYDGKYTLVTHIVKGEESEVRVLYEIERKSDIIVL